MTLKEMRIEAGYSQTKLAELSGINLRSLQDYEQGHKLLSSAKGETLYRLSQVLGYSIEDILLGSSINVDVWGSDEERMKNRLLAYKKALEKEKNVIVHFPVVVSDDKIDMGRVYPTKQRMVKAVIDELRDDERVESIRLFGSSITMRCNKDSDLDFAIGLTEITDAIKNSVSEKIQLCCDWGADILWMDRLSSEDRIYNEVMQGLVIICNKQHNHTCGYM